MSNEDLKQEIRDLISKNRTEQAIERLSNAQFSQVDKELIILNSQYNRVQEEIRMNLISRDEADRKINTINKSLLELSERIQKGDNDLASVLAKRAGEKSSFQKWWPLLLIPVFLVGIYWVAAGGNQSDEQIEENKNDPQKDTGQVSEINQDSIDQYNLSLERRQDSIADYNNRNPPPPTTMKVKFVLRQLEVIKDGDSLDDGDFTWSFRVNGQVIESRSSEFNLGNEDVKNFNREYTVSLPIDSGTINFDASIVEVDGGFNGSNDFINIDSSYSNPFLRGLQVGQRQDDSKVGTHRDGDPQVQVHWSIIRLE